MATDTVSLVSRKLAIDVYVNERDDLHALVSCICDRFELAKARGDDIDSVAFRLASLAQEIVGSIRTEGCLRECLKIGEDCNA